MFPSVEVMTLMRAIKERAFIFIASGSNISASVCRVSQCLLHISAGVQLKDEFRHLLESADT